MNKQRVIEEDLKKITIDDSGWQTLYCDKQGRFWLKTYQHSELHGGGDPTIELVSTEKAKSIFSFLP